MKKRIKSVVMRDRVLTESSNPARELFNQSRYGIILPSGQNQLTFCEALYLFEANKIRLVDDNNKVVKESAFVRVAMKLDKRFMIRYQVFKDLRTRGYIVKTALKFGADFRVYDRGVKPGEDHARWVVYPVHESESLTWYEFAAKNRVAHSTKKRLLMGIVDGEGDITYYEIAWKRP